MASHVERPARSLCHKDDYLTPLEIGLTDEPLIFDEPETAIDNTARATYTCIEEGFDWNCEFCRIYFSND